MARAECGKHSLITPSCETPDQVLNQNENFRKKDKHSDETPESTGFEILIRRIALGSEEAVWELLDRYSTNILRVVRRHLPAELRPKVDSVDIVQSVWKSLLRKGAAFNHIGDAEQFVGYIAGVARNKVFEMHRHFTKHAQFDIRREVPLEQRQSGTSSEDIPTPEYIDPRCLDPGEVVHARDNWERAMHKAGERGQHIVQLRLQGLTLEEIAEETGLSKITVRRTLASVLTSLTV